MKNNMDLNMFVNDLKEKKFWFKEYFKTYFKAFFVIGLSLISVSYIFYDNPVVKGILSLLNQFFNYDFSRFAFSIMCLICLIVIYLVCKPISFLLDSENWLCVLLVSYSSDLLHILLIFFISIVISIITFIFITVPLIISLLITAIIMVITFTIVALIKNFTV